MIKKNEKEKYLELLLSTTKVFHVKVLWSKLKFCVPKYLFFNTKLKC